MFNITSKYFSFFNNKPPASWVTHITRDFLTSYSCSYYSSMIIYINHYHGNANQLKNEMEQKKMRDLSYKCTKYSIPHIIPSILFWASQDVQNFGLKYSRTQELLKNIFIFHCVFSNMFSSHTIVFKYVKLAKKAYGNSKQLYFFSHCFGNSNSCVQIKSCDNIFDPSYSFYHKFGKKPYQNVKFLKKRERGKR